MKAAVFSDTHGVTSLMLEAVRRCRPDVMIHLGDYERDAERLREELRGEGHVEVIADRESKDFFSLA